MPFEGPEETAGGGLPEAHSFVVAGGGEQESVGTKGDASDGAFMTCEAEEPAGRYLPEAHGLVFTGGGEQESVGAEGDASDGTRVAAERTHLLPGS